MQNDLPIALSTVLRWIFLWGLPTIAFTAIAAFLVNLPAIRTERARLFLDILNLGLERGSTPEQTLVAAANSRDRSLGARFHLLAEQIRSGVRFPEALRLAPSLVPHKIRAMLCAGAEAGILGGAVQAARRATQFPDAQIRAAISCQIVMLFIINPLVLAALPFFTIRIFPAMSQVAGGLKQSIPATMMFLVDHTKSIFLFQVASVLLLYLGALFYIGGNRFTRWLEAGLFPLSDWIALRIPWRRKRMHRDFASMFTLLLDAGLPETRALELAGDSTGNEIFRRRIRKCIGEMREGVTLMEALRLVDPPGEFCWRIANALQRKANYAGALEGWFEAVDAETQAEEQAAGDFISTSLVVLNGVIVGLMIAAVMECVYRFSLYPIS